jgi:hypothetical protein
LLITEGFIVGNEDGYGTPHDIEYRLETFLREKGSLAAEKLVKERIDRDRRARDY